LSLKARCSFKTPFLFAAAIYKSYCSRKESSKAFCFLSYNLKPDLFIRKPDMFRSVVFESRE
jgi:hypothetical protein